MLNNCRVAVVSLVPKRAMASSTKPPPSQSSASSSSSNDVSKSDTETQVTKTEQSTREFINYSHRPGYKTDQHSRDTYLNPLLTPPPRSPSTPEDFRHPGRLGHWRSLGFDYSSKVADTYYYHEYLFGFVVGGVLTLWMYKYGPDYKLRDWARREAFLRTAKREALGLPLVDRDVVPVERIVLPTEEELGDFPVVM